MLFGPSGSGKTLTLDLVAGFVRPDEGRILLDDQILFDAAAHVNLAPQARHCGYVFQNYALFPHMTLRQNLEFAAERRPRLERHRRINEMLDHTRELLNSVLEVNFSLISMAQNEISNKQNEVSKRFAGWAAILGLPTMVAGIYGMNFKFIPELEWHWGYPIVLLLTFCACVFLYHHFRRSGWL